MTATSHFSQCVNLYKIQTSVIPDYAVCIDKHRCHSLSFVGGSFTRKGSCGVFTDTGTSGLHEELGLCSGCLSTCDNELVSVVATETSEHPRHNIMSIYDILFRLL